MKKWTPVQVFWVDAHGGDAGWMDQSELLHSPKEITTVGMVYRDNAQGITVIFNRDHDADHIGGYIFIPKVNIVSIRELQ